MKVVLANPIFQSVETMKPLAFDAGGSQAGFRQADCTSTLNGGPKAVYKCGGNLFWTLFLHLTNPRVPLSELQIKLCKDFYFKLDNLPSSFPFNVIIGVDSADFHVLEHKGALRVLSPDEPRHAYIFQCADAINANADDGVLRKLRDLALNVSMEFEVCEPGEPSYWRAQNLRETDIERGETVKKTTRQWIYDVTGFKAEQEHISGSTMSVPQVAKKFKANITCYSRTTEKVSEALKKTKTKKGE